METIPAMTDVESAVEAVKSSYGAAADWWNRCTAAYGDTFGALFGVMGPYGYAAAFFFLLTLIFTIITLCKRKWGVGIPGIICGLLTIAAALLWRYSWLESAKGFWYAQTLPTTQIVALSVSGVALILVILCIVFSAVKKKPKVRPAPNGYYNNMGPNPRAMQPMQNGMPMQQGYPQQMPGAPYGNPMPNFGGAPMQQPYATQPQRAMTPPPQQPVDQRPIPPYWLNQTPSAAQSYPAYQQQPAAKENPAPDQPEKKLSLKKEEPAEAQPTPEQTEAQPAAEWPEQPSAGNAQPAAVDPVQVLQKFKELLDMGAITQEEFDERKKRLLGL